MSLNKTEMSSSRERPPAPSLFVGPPSQNASTASFHHQLSPNTASDRSQDQRDSDQPESRPDAYQRGARPKASRNTTLENKRTEAIWAEMQNTLEEVELSAASGNAFSADHARALEELRNAQIMLAQSWARSQAEHESVHKDGQERKGDGVEGENLDEMGSLGRGSFSNRARAGSRGSTGGGKTQLEEDTENDILQARKRRQANDRYFERVNKGVVDVVGKLEEVAAKMRMVEKEAQDMWSDKDSLESDDSP